MSELRSMVVDVIERLCKKHNSNEQLEALEAGKWAQALWDDIEVQQFLAVALPEHYGGAGGDIGDILAICRVVGYYAAPIPLQEHYMSNALLTMLQEVPYETRTTYAFEPLTLTQQCVSGTVYGVLWAQVATQLVAIAKKEEVYYVVVLPLAASFQEPSTNLAYEPRTTVTFHDVTPLITRPIHREQFIALQALVTAGSIAKITGTIEKVVALSVQYSKEREQFGKPLHRFQLVQRHIAELAGERAIMQTMLQQCELALEQGDMNAIAYARIRAEQAITTVTAAAHQLQAAMGMTYEYPLHYYTKRLWAWRDEDITARTWQQYAAQQFLTSDASLWEMLTRGKQT